MIGAPCLDEDNDLVLELFAYYYTQYGRQRKDFRARPMPRVIFDLAVVLWRVALPYLGVYSSRHPPTACQLLLCTPLLTLHLSLAQAPSIIPLSALRLSLLPLCTAAARYIPLPETTCLLL
jgi:hypothetical protein